jgi:hypothetical protein
MASISEMLGMTEEERRRLMEQQEGGEGDMFADYMGTTEQGLQPGYNDPEVPQERELDLDFKPQYIEETFQPIPQGEERILTQETATPEMIQASTMPVSEFSMDQPYSTEFSEAQGHEEETPEDCYEICMGAMDDPEKCADACNQSPDDPDEDDDPDAPEPTCYESCMEQIQDSAACLEHCGAEPNDPPPDTDEDEDEDDGPPPESVKEFHPIDFPDTADVPDAFDWDPANPPPAPTPPTLDPTGNYEISVDPLTGLPDFQAPAGPGEAPDFQGITDELAGYESPGDIDAAPDFDAITGELGGFEAPGDPDAAPGFEHGAGEYQTPEGAFQGEDVYQNLDQFSQDWLNNPNRYLSELAESTRATSELELDKYEQDASRTIDEKMSQRGLVGSSYEGEAQIDLQGELARARAGRETDILRELTGAETADKAAAGALGRDTTETGINVGEARRSEAEIAQQLALERGHLEITAQDQQDAAEQWRSELALDEAGTQSSQDRADAALKLAAAENTEEGILARAELGISEARYAADSELATAGLALDSAAMAEGAARYRSEFALQVEQVGLDSAFRNVELEQRDAVERASIELDAVIAGDRAAIARAQQELDGIRMREQAIMDRETLTQRDQELELRAHEIATDAALRGVEIETDQARIQAELEWRREEIASQERLGREEETGLMQRHDDWIDAEFGDI